MSYWYVLTIWFIGSQHQILLWIAALAKYIILFFISNFSSSYSVSEFFDAREYTTDAGDDSDLDSTEDEDIDEDDDEEEDEFLDDDSGALKRDRTLEASSSVDESDVTPVWS